MSNPSKYRSLKETGKASVEKVVQPPDGKRLAKVSFARFDGDTGERADDQVNVYDPEKLQEMRDELQDRIESIDLLLADFEVLEDPEPEEDEEEAE